MKHIHTSPNVRITIAIEGKEPQILDGITEYAVIYDSQESELNCTYYGKISSVYGKAHWFIDYLRGLLNADRPDNA